MLKLDLLFNIVGALLFYVLSLLAQVHPPAEPDMAQPGNIVVSATWAPGPDDVDLWLASPKDKAIGYSNKSGAVWSLLRDDLGEANDETPLNYESAFTRGTPDGEYIVNLRCYSCLTAQDVDVEVRLANGVLVWRGVVHLAGNKDEKTAVRWRMSDGRVVAGSESFIYKEVRA